MLKRDVSSSTMYAVMSVELMVTNGSLRRSLKFKVKNKIREREQKTEIEEKIERNVDLALRTTRKWNTIIRHSSISFLFKKRWIVNITIIIIQVIVFDHCINIIIITVKIFHIFLTIVLRCSKRQQTCTYIRPRSRALFFSSFTRVNLFTH